MKKMFLNAIALFYYFFGILSLRYSAILTSTVKKKEKGICLFFCNKKVCNS